MPASGNGRLALAGLIVAVSMTTIDQTIVALSAPTVEADLSLDHGAMQWAVNVYLITTAAFFLLGGRLADIFGHRRMVLIGIVGFGLTSLLCGLAPTGDFAGAWLITARALQGVTGAIMFPAAIGIVVQAFPRQGRAKAMAAFFAITGAMTAIGPIAGGYLTEWTWRSVFWVNVPLAIVAVIIVAISAPKTPRVSERVDLLGALVIAVGIALVVFGLQQSGSWGWTSIWVIGSLVLGVLFIVLFLFVERRVSQPLVKLQVFRDRGFTVSVLSLLFASIAFLPSFYFLSVYGQVSLQLSAIDAGLLFLKFFIGFVVAAQIGARMFERAGAQIVIILGGLLGVAGFGWLAFAVRTIPASPDDFFNAQTWPILLAGAGIGFMLSAASTDAVNRAIGASYGEVTAISQTMRNFGGALGLAVLTSVVTHALQRAITDAVVRMGGSAADAQDAVNRIAQGTGPGDSTSGLSPQMQGEIAQAIQQSYADAVFWAFFGGAIAMAVVVLLGLFYPRGQVSSTFTDGDPATEPEAAPAAPTA
jgi:EmrB/QacA subfamily drug resistance transporter